MALILNHTLIKIVNEVLGDHNVEKQMTDSRGDVSDLLEVEDRQKANHH